MYPATCPTSIQSVAFLHTSQLFNLSLSLCLSPDVSASPHLHLCSVLLWKPRHRLYFKDVFVSLAVYPSDWAPRHRDAVWKLPSASGEGQEPALGVRFLQTRSLQGDDSWRNALLIPPNAGHMRVVWVASRGGGVMSASYSMTHLSHAGSGGVYLQEHVMCRYSAMEPRLCAGVWPSIEARRDSQQQLEHVVTHFLSVPEAQTGLLAL